MNLRVLVLAIAATLSLCSSATAQDGSWFADPTNGCKSWWQKTSAFQVQSIRWRGACDGGLAQGRGTLVVVGKWPGAVQFITWNGEGTLVDGKISGRAFLVSGNSRLEGEYRDGALNGRGIVTFENPEAHTWYKFEGEYRDGRKNGWGVESGKGRESTDIPALLYHYEGEYKNDKRSGKGKLTERGEGCAALYTYEGEWLDGEYEGHGTLRTANDLVYSGVWSHGKGVVNGETIVLWQTARIWDVCRK